MMMMMMTIDTVVQLWAPTHISPLLHPLPLHFLKTHRICINLKTGPGAGWEKLPCVFVYVSFFMYLSQTWSQGHNMQGQGQGQGQVLGLGLGLACYGLDSKSAKDT